jgi:parallel beta-helix repeat protein
MKQRQLAKRGLVFLLVSIFICSSILPFTGAKHDHNITSFNSRTTLYVGGSGPGNYSTIQEAINNASDGDTVFVFGGIYYEHVQITKEISVIGEDKQTTIIDGNNSGDVVTISSHWIIVKGFTITHGVNGISIDGRFTNNTIKGNIITENVEYGLDLTSFCEYNIISENIISKNTNGTYMSTASYNEIVGNTFEDNSDYGLCLIMWCNENVITQNNFINNKYHAFFFLSALNTWNKNYWGRPRLFPKPIFGLMGIIPWVNFDWRPLMIPYATP